MTKTIRVGKETWEKMRKLLDAGDAKRFDELIRKLIDQSLQVPRSMFGVDKHRKVQLTLKNTKRSRKMPTERQGAGSGSPSYRPGFLCLD